MKKITILLAALAPLIAAAKPISAMSKDDVAVLDESRWGNAIITGGPALKTAGDILRKVDTITALLKACTDQNALIDPEKSDLLKRLLEALTVPIATTEAFEEKDARGREYVRGIERANRLVIMSQSIGKMNKKTLRWLINDIISFQIVERRYRWRSAFTTLEAWNMSERYYRPIDLGYEKFMNAVDTLIIKNTGQDISGSELMMLSGLDKFARDDGRASPWVQADARLVDRYLRILNTDARKLFSDYIKHLKESSANTLAALDAEHTFFEEYAIKMYPKDRENFANFYKEWARFLEKLDERVVKESEVMIAKAEDKSGEVGKLRYCAGFSPHGAFKAVGAIPSNGCPEYKDRIASIFEKCRARYLNHLDALRRRHPDDKRIPKGWQ